MQRTAICGAPAYIAARGCPRDTGDLKDHDCIGFARDGRSHVWMLPANGGGELQPFRIVPRHIVGHGEALHEAIASGLGLGYLATWMASEDLRSGRLIAVLTDIPFMSAPITALWPKSRETSPKVRVAVDALVEAFLPVPPWDEEFI